jgi:hypothetical protein
MPLTQLIYVSRRTDALTLDALREVVGQSRVRNASLGLTGVLLCCGRHLMQLLEGDPEAVRATFDRIEADPRHADVACIYSKPVRRRLFAEWSMELFDLGSKAVLDTGRLTRLIEDVRARTDTASYGVEARILLADFKQQLPCEGAGAPAEGLETSAK